MGKMTEQGLLSFEENVQSYRKRDQLSIDECRDVTIKILESVSAADKIVRTKKKYPSLEAYYEDKIKKPGISIAGNLAKAKYDEAEEKYKKYKWLLIGLSAFFIIIFLLVMSSGGVAHDIGSVLFLSLSLLMLDMMAIIPFLGALAKRNKARAEYNNKINEDERLNRKRREEYELNLPIIKKKLAIEYHTLVDGLENAERVLAIASENNVLSEAYFDAADQFLNYLKSGRADTLKEAFSLLENEKYQQKMYNLQMKHNAQMEHETRKQAEALQAQAVAAQIQAETAQEQARVQQRELRVQTEEARRQAQAAQRLADSQRGSGAQCSNCMNRNGCTIKGNPPRNCGAFRSRY